MIVDVTVVKRFSELPLTYITIPYKFQIPANKIISSMYSLKLWLGGCISNP